MKIGGKHHGSVINEARPDPLIGRWQQQTQIRTEQGTGVVISDYCTHCKTAQLQTRMAHQASGQACEERAATEKACW
jgi:DnaJ-class molecular chaperone